MNPIRMGLVSCAVEAALWDVGPSWTPSQPRSHRRVHAAPCPVTPFSRMGGGGEPLTATETPPRPQHRHVTPLAPMEVYFNVQGVTLRDTTLHEEGGGGGRAATPHTHTMNLRLAVALFFATEGT